MPDIADVAWSERDDRNSEHVPAGWPQGTMPAYVDEVGRMMMGATKRFWNKINPIYQTTGTGDAYVVQTEVGVDQLNLYELLCIRIDRSNVGTTPTLQFGATNARTIVKAGPSGYVPLAAGDLFIGNSHTFWYNGTFYVLTDPAIIIGGNVQPYSPNLTTWAAITRAPGYDAFAATPTSANLRALVTDESGTGALLFQNGALGTPVSGVATNLTGLPLTTGVTGQLPIANGGTGQATASAAFDALSPTTTRGDLIFRNATTNARLAASTAGYLLQTNGAGTDPTWAGFLQSGTGAVTRTWQDKGRDVFNVADFGAKGDLQSVTSNVTINSGSPNLLVAGGTFVAGDVGKRITVAGAGTAGNVLATTILTVTNATNIVLASNAATTLSASSQLVAWATDDTAAIQAAITAAGTAGGGCVVASGGKRYGVTSAITVPVNVSFRGADKYSTRISPMVPNITCFTMTNAVLTLQRSMVGHLTFESFCANTGGISTVLASRVAFTDLEFMGVTTTISMDRGFFFLIRTVYSYGANGFQAGGMLLLSSSITDYLYHGVIDDCKIVSIGNGTAAIFMDGRRLIDCAFTNIQSYAAYACTIIQLVDDCQAVKVANANIDGCNIGVALSPVGGRFPTFTSVTDSHIDQPTTVGISVNTAQYTSLENIYITARNGFTGATAISCASDYRTKIVNCTPFNFTTGAAGVGIQLSASQLCTIRNYQPVSCWIGLGISGACPTLEVDGDFYQATNAIAGTLAADTIIRPGLRGVNPVALGYVAVSQSVPASTVSKTNSTGFQVMASVMGGTFTVVTINGQAFGVSNNNFTFPLKPGDTIAITYSAAPSMNWWPM
jgi:hypothetical protein